MCMQMAAYYVGPGPTSSLVNMCYVAMLYHLKVCWGDALGDFTF